MSTTTSTEKKDIFQRVTDQIVEAIEAGTETYRLPWRASGGFPCSPINAVSKRPYRGINVVILWATAEQKGYKSGVWATFKQWQEMGAQVRKGEKSAHVAFWKFFDKEQSQGTEGDKTKNDKIPMARDYFVFNAEQVDGFQKTEAPTLSRAVRIGRAESFFQTLGVDPRPGGNRAYYCPTSDAVHMPPFEAFREPLFYYSVLSHESTHWSGAPHRLNRDLSGRFHTESYAMEELVAELGAAFLCSELGLPTDPRQDHAPYIASWLKVLKNDKRAIFTAAAKAQEAVDWMTKKTAPELEEAA
jgi:antirestriction protein ArdC